MKFISLLLLVVVGRIAIANAAEVPVLEIYAGPRTKGAECLEPFLAQLDRSGFLTRPGSIRDRLGARFPLPGNDPTLRAADFARQLDLADASWVKQPALEELLPQLDAAVEAGKTNPAFLVTDPNRREVFRRVLLALALARRRSGNVRASEEAMAEWIRTFPGEVITRMHDGSDAEQLYTDTRKALSKRGRGTLTVNLDDQSLQLYVNEVIHRSGAAVADLLPGLYRVLVLDSYNNARRYMVEVLANQDAVLTIDWPLDSALNVTASYAAFEFATMPEFAQAGRSVSRYVQGAFKASEVVLVNVIKTGRGQVTVTAALYSAKRAAPVRRAAVELAEGVGANAERLAALARFIAGREPSRDLTQVSQDEARTARVTPPAVVAAIKADAAPVQVMGGFTSRHPYVVPATLFAGGLGIVASGMYLLKVRNFRKTNVDGMPVLTQNGVYQEEGIYKPGLAMVVGGSLPLFVGGCWLLWNASSPSNTKPLQRTVSVEPLDRGGVVTFAGTF